MAPTWMALLGVFCFTACSEDPELLRIQEEQKKEIAGLRAEHSLLVERLKLLAPEEEDGTAEDSAETRLAAAEDRLAELTAELESLAESRKRIEQDFANYRSKYPLPNQP